MGLRGSVRPQWVQLGMLLLLSVLIGMLALTFLGSTSQSAFGRTATIQSIDDGLICLSIGECTDLDEIRDVPPGERVQLGDCLFIETSRDDPRELRSVRWALGEPDCSPPSPPAGPSAYDPRYFDVLDTRPVLFKPAGDTGVKCTLEGTVGRECSQRISFLRDGRTVSSALRELATFYRPRGFDLVEQGADSERVWNASQPGCDGAAMVISPRAGDDSVIDVTLTRRLC